MSGDHVTIKYTVEQGGEFFTLSLEHVHSIFLPDGSIYDATLGGWRDKPETWTNPKYAPKKDLGWDTDKGNTK